MSLSHRSRSALYDRLSPIIGDDEVVEEFLSQFPARDLEEPVSKEFHRAESVLMRADFQRDMAALRADMERDMAALRADMERDMATLREEIAEFKAEVREEIAEFKAEVREEIAALRVEMHKGFRTMTLSLAGLMVAMSGVLVAAITVTS